MKQAISHFLILGTLAGVVMFTNLGKARLWDRDEPRNAGCALEMMQRGDMVVPIFNDQLRHQKPVLLYWLIISAYQAFGVNEFAARFWSALLAIGTVLATYALGRRLLNPTAAFYGAIALATSIMFAVAGRAATPDSLLMFCSTMAILLYVLGTFAPRGNPSDAPRLRWEGYYFPESWSCVLWMYVLMGIGVLAKGPVAVILPCSIIGMFMLIGRLKPIDNEVWNARGWLARLAISILRPFQPRHFAETVWKMRPITALVTVSLIAVPWYWTVGVRTDWDWPRIFFISENLGRASATFENHGGGIWYYPLAILIGFFPWSVFIGPTVVGIDRQITRRHHWSLSYQFLLCWVCVQVGLFSLAGTKLPSYVTPCYPALALLTGAFLYQVAQGYEIAPAKLSRLSFTSLIFSGVVISVALLFVGREFLDGQIRLAVLGLIPALGGAVALVLFGSQRQQQAVATCCLAAALFVVALFGFATVEVDRFQKSDVVLNHVANDRDAKVATFECHESSWVFYGRKPIYELTADVNNSQWKDDRKRFWESKSWPSPEQFVAENPNALIITLDEKVDELRSRLPKGFHIIEQTPYFLRDKQLVLLGRQPAAWPGESSVPPQGLSKRQATGPDADSTNGWR